MAEAERLGSLMGRISVARFRRATRRSYVYGGIGGGGGFGVGNGGGGGNGTGDGGGSFGIIGNMIRQRL